MDFNMLEIRLRGDGRSYLLNITCSGYYDLMWNDVYTYPLYTRGGPHWQLTRVRVYMVVVVVGMLESIFFLVMWKGGAREQNNGNKQNKCQIVSQELAL